MDGKTNQDPLLDTALSLLEQGRISEEEYLRLTGREAKVADEPAKSPPAPEREEPAAGRPGKKAGGGAGLANPYFYAGAAAGARPGQGQGGYGQPGAPARENLGRKRIFRPVDLVLGLGVLFISLAGEIFATGTWHSLPNQVRFAVMVLICALFFGVSAFAEKKLKLASTAMAVHLLGCLFIFAAVLVGGHFHTFGPWLSLEGDGRHSLWALALLLTGAAVFWGYLRFSRPPFLYFSLLFGEFAVFSLFFQNGLLGKGGWPLCFASLFAGFYMAVFYIFRRWTLPTQRQDTIFTRLVLVNFYVLSLLTLFIVKSVPTVISALGILAVALLAVERKKLRFGWHIAAAAMLHLFTGVAFGLYLYSWGRSLVFSLLCMGGYLLFRFVRYPAGKAIDNWVANALFTAAVFVMAMDWISHRLSFVHFALLAIMLVSTAMRRSGGALARVFSWLTAGLPFVLEQLLSGLFSGRSDPVLFYHAGSTIAVLLITFCGAVAAAGFTARRFGRRLELPLATALVAFGLWAWLRYGGMGLAFAAGAAAGQVRAIACGLLALYCAFCALWARKGRPGRVYCLAGGAALGATAALACAGIVRQAVWLFAGEQGTPLFASLFYAVLLVFAVAAFAAAKYTRGKEAPMRRVAGWSVALLSQAALFEMFYYSTGTIVYRNAYTVANMVLMVLAFVVLYAYNKSICGALVPFLLLVQYVRIAQLVSVTLQNWWLGLPVFALFIVVGRLLYPKLAGVKNKTFYVDFFHISSAGLAIQLLTRGGRNLDHVGGMLLCLWFLLFIGRIRAKYWNRVIGAVGGFVMMLLLMRQPFLTIPALWRTEVNLFFFLAYFVLLRHTVFRRAKGFGWLVFAAFCIAFFIQGVDSIATGYVWKGVVLGGYAVAVFVFACYRRQKRWLLLSALTLLGVLLYHTADYWASLAWWLYLLVAGVLLLVLAALNEGYRQKGSNLAKSLFSLGVFSRWKW